MHHTTAKLITLEIELLIRLQQVRLCCQRTVHNNQLADGEKNSIRFFKSLVRVACQRMC